MPTELTNFVTIRKTPGDVLPRATYRSTVSMIKGMIKEYDFVDFNAAYRSFLLHLADYHDPHHTIHTDFFPQIITRTYEIYAQMTGDPMTSAAFADSFVKTPAFLELLRRIVLNRYIYNQIRNPDGTVNATVSVYLGPDWHPVLETNTPVTVSFGRNLLNEEDFIATGWQHPTTPMAVVFTADNLDPVEPTWDEVFHTSVDVPYFAGLGVSAGYFVPLNISSNDVRIHTLLDGTSTADQLIYQLSNQTQTLSVTYTATKKVSLTLGTTAVGSPVLCTDRRFWLTFSHPNVVAVKVENNGVFTTTTFTLPGTTAPFTQIKVIPAITSLFAPAILGLRELTIQRLGS